MNFNERKEIINRIIEKYKQFCFDDNNDAKIKWFSLNRYYADFMEAFMCVDLSNMSIEIYKFNKTNDTFDNADIQLLNKEKYNSFEKIVMAIDSNLKKYLDFKKEKLKNVVNEL
jgi:hypothetical protein